MSKGIDIAIDKLVQNFNDNLWVGKNNSFYGRVFRNERFENFSSKIAPEIWKNGKDYVEVLKNDNFDGQCFFDVQPNIAINGNVYTAEVWLCFMLNLQSVYPAIPRTEATEEAHRDTSDIIVYTEFEMNGLVTGFQGFTGYDWGDNADQARSDMSPNYLFRYNLNLTYVNKKC